MLDNKVAINLMIGLSSLVSLPIVANNSSQSFQPYSKQLAGNPWTIPAAPDKQPGFDSPVQKTPAQDRYSPLDSSGFYSGAAFPESSDRYVTPEIIESLKQSPEQPQTLPQAMSNTNYRMRRQQYNTTPLLPDYNGGQGMGSMPQRGMSNSLYDVPTVSPWSNAPDVLYRGEDMPWMPDEAFGGMPPIPTSPYLGNYGFGGTEKQYSPALNNQFPTQNNVLNPFTFAPGGNW